MSASTSDGWWKAPTRFLPSGELIAVLPPTLELTWASRRGRDLDEAHAAPQRRGAEAGEIADDAAAERDDEVAPLDPRLDQRVADPREFGVGLGRLARRADDRPAVVSPRGLEALPQRRRDAASRPSRR